MQKIILYHGSDHVIPKPKLSLGKPNNDYGQGFYCTEDVEMAKEWACKKETNGIVNEYELETNDLNVLNLLDDKYNILNWLALLLKNRVFNLQDDISIDARNYIISNFGIDLSNYDIVIGYRADDSYFSFAYSFITNTLPLMSLNKAMRLGKLGTQIVLISNKAFEHLRYLGMLDVDKAIYSIRFSERDVQARKTYREEIRNGKNYRDDIFVMDILREGMKNDDPRIQRIVSK